MSELRDQIAIAAMNGLVSSNAFHGGIYQQCTTHAAEFAYQMADAMIAQRDSDAAKGDQDLEDIKLQMISGPLTTTLVDRARYHIVKLQAELNRAKEPDLSALIEIVAQAYDGSPAEVACDIAKWLREGR